MCVDQDVLRNLVVAPLLHHVLLPQVAMYANHATGITTTQYCLNEDSNQPGRMS